MSVKLKTGMSARQLTATQSPHYLNKYYKYNMTDQVTAQTTGSTSPTLAGIMGVLPAYAIPLQLYVNVFTAFSSGNLKIGTTADLSTLCSTNDVASGTTGLYVVDRYMGTVSTVDTVFYCVTDTTGCGAGEASIWLQYLPDQTPTTR